MIQAADDMYTRMLRPVIGRGNVYNQLRNCFYLVTRCRHKTRLPPSSMMSTLSGFPLPELAPASSTCPGQQHDRPVEELIAAVLTTFDLLMLFTRSCTQD